MKGVPIPTGELEELRVLLAKAGLIKRDAVLDLLPYHPTFPRRTAQRNAHYLVSSKQEAICHLVAGKNLAPLHARARNFFAACPKLACRPLLYHDGSGSTDYLCLEHFSGESLDVAVQNGRYSAADWLKTVRRAQDLLERTGQPSDQAHLQEEIGGLVSGACAFPGFSNIDIKLLHELAQPAMQEATAGDPLVMRWSTGDFVGRNLLVDTGGGVRLIDYEYATRTHFGRADWLRLMEFSVLPPGLEASSIKELNFTSRPGHEVYLWLHHLSLLRDAEPTEETKRHIASTVRNLFAAVHRVDGRKSSTHSGSYLIGSLLDSQLETEAVLQERTAWAKSLNTELEKARADLAAQNGLVEERSAWAKSLDLELGSARQNLEKLTAEHAERTAWAQSLEQELHSTKTSFAKLSAEHSERTAWAMTLDAELQRARSAHQEQEKNTASLVLERNNLTTTIASLEVNLATLASLRRELAVKNAATQTAVASTLEAQLRAEIAESASAGLTAALRDAQIHVDGLLQRAANLQEELTLMAAAKLKAEDRIRQREQELALAIVDLQTTKVELARYANRLICRLVAGTSRATPPGQLPT